jgi:hypothetical protein
MSNRERDRGRFQRGRRAVLRAESRDVENAEYRVVDRVRWTERRSSARRGYGRINGTAWQQTHTYSRRGNASPTASELLVAGVMEGASRPLSARSIALPRGIWNDSARLCTCEVTIRQCSPITKTAFDHEYALGHSPQYYYTNPLTIPDCATKCLVFPLTPDQSRAPHEQAVVPYRISKRRWNKGSFWVDPHCAH